MDTKKVTDTQNGKAFLKLIPVYILCVLILFSYFFILLLKPDVCLEYKMYYIDNTLSDWPGYGGLNYKFGETVFFGKNKSNAVSKRRGEGWAEREADFCFTDGKSSSVYFVLESTEALEITLSVKEMACKSYSVYINETPLAENLTYQNTSFTLKAPKELIKSELLELTFKIESPTKLSSEYKTGKTGFLGVQLESLTITESK